MGFGGQYGYYTDRETGLVLMGHRYYDLGTGRFLTRDPMGYGGGMNLYGYADGNPVNESDPSGFGPMLEPYSGPGIDWEKVGAVMSRFLRSGAIRRAAKTVFTEVGESQPLYSGQVLETPPVGTEGTNGPASVTNGPTIAFNRDYHYGRTPNTAQKRAVPPGMIFDHDPPLVKHYYEGDGKGGVPGHQMSQQEREAYAGRVDVGKPSTQEESDRQGPVMRGYGVRMRKKSGLPPFNLPRRVRRPVK